MVSVAYEIVWVRSNRNFGKRILRVTVRAGWVCGWCIFFVWHTVWLESVTGRYFNTAILIFMAYYQLLLKFQLARKLLLVKKHGSKVLYRLLYLTSEEGCVRVFRATKKNLFPWDKEIKIVDLSSLSTLSQQRWKNCINRESIWFKSKHLTYLLKICENNNVVFSQEFTES